MKKNILIFIAVCLIILGGYFVFARESSKDATSKDDRRAEGTLKDTIRLVAVGDLLAHDTVNQNAKTVEGYNYQPYFAHVEEYFQSSDIRFCNQEGPSGGEELGISGYPVFNAPTQFAEDLSAVGCNVINLANNHLSDKGQSGIDNTRQAWDELNPRAIAAANRSAEEQKTIKYFEIKGVKFAFVAYSEISNIKPPQPFSLNLLGENLVRTQLLEARKNADIVMVSVHWGTENSSDINGSQEKWSKEFASFGADLVIGTGPHVIQPVKRIPKSGGGETIIYFSLGNLLSTQLEVESLIGGLAVVDIDQASKKIVNLGFLPTYMHYEWTVEQKKKEDLLARKNLNIYLLEQASEPLSRSQNNTTVDVQMLRISDLLNKFTQVKILKLNEF